MIITIKHLRQAKYCNRGARLWFKAHNLSFDDFRKHGIDSKVLEDLGDRMGLRLVELANGQ